MNFHHFLREKLSLGKAKPFWQPAKPGDGAITRFMPTTLAIPWHS